MPHSRLWTLERRSPARGWRHRSVPGTYLVFEVKLSQPFGQATPFRISEASVADGPVRVMAITLGHPWALWAVAGDSTGWGMIVI